MLIAVFCIFPPHFNPAITILGVLSLQQTNWHQFFLTYVLLRWLPTVLTVCTPEGGWRTKNELLVSPLGLSSWRSQWRLVTHLGLQSWLENIKGSTYNYLYLHDYSSSPSRVSYRQKHRYLSHGLQTVYVLERKSKQLLVRMWNKLYWCSTLPKGNYARMGHPEKLECCLWRIFFYVSLELECSTSQPSKWCSRKSYQICKKSTWSFV